MQVSSNSAPRLEATGGDVSPSTSRFTSGDAGSHSAEPVARNAPHAPPASD